MITHLYNKLSAADILSSTERFNLRYLHTYHIVQHRMYTSLLSSDYKILNNITILNKLNNDNNNNT
jgi:hypothetical protein